MTTQTRLACLHDSRAVCPLCSDQDPRWRSWRVGLGVGEEPPNVRRRRVLPRVVLERKPVPLPVIEKKEEPRTIEGWRGWYQRKFGRQA